MSAKTSVSSTESQERLRPKSELADAELVGLRGLLLERRAGDFISVNEGRERTQRMIAAKASSDAL